MALKIQEWGERMRKVIRPLHETTNNPKSHLHIPQPKKGIYVLNIIIHNIMEKRTSDGKGPQRNTQNPNATNKGVET